MSECSVGPEVRPKMRKKYASKDKSCLCRVQSCERATKLVVLLPIIYELCAPRVVLNTTDFIIVEFGSWRILLFTCQWSVNHFQHQCMGAMNHTLSLTHLRLEDEDFLRGNESKRQVNILPRVTLRPKEERVLFKEEPGTTTKVTAKPYL